MNQTTDPTSPAARAAVCLTRVEGAAKPGDEAQGYGSIVTLQPGASGGLGARSGARGEGHSGGAPSGRRPGRSPWATGLALLALGSGAALLGACPGPSFTVEDGPGGCSGTPATNPSVVSDKCGVFVAPAGSDDTGTGTRASPYKTLGKAIEAAGAKAAGGPARVFACAGTYGESVAVPGNTELFGSLDCEAGTWTPGMAKSVVAGAADMVAARLLSGGPIVIEGFRIEAASAEAPGGSSIAVLAEPMAQVDIRGSELVAGDGAEGAKGMDGNQDPPMTMPTGAANKGLDACANMVTNPGGIEHSNECGGSEASLGGPGGAGLVLQAGDGADGIAIPAPMTPAGAGGTGAAECDNGGNGAPGTAGAPGEPGAPNEGEGALSVAAGYVGVSGGAGTKGKPGQGGGGGAGQLGTTSNCPMNMNKTGAGASGGSGGAGGCGGEGGGGGGPGGSSIALVSISASVTLTGVMLQAGKGGRGGAGGDAQVGGLGVPGAMGGGNNGNVALKIGCMGGDGGPGGGGGQGAGGNGGHSLGIAHFGDAPAGSFEAATGMPGAGGLGGNAGYAGKAAEIRPFTALDPG